MQVEFHLSVSKGMTLNLPVPKESFFSAVPLDSCTKGV